MFMLVAGAITCIATYIRNDTILEKLVALLVTFLIFFAIGRFLEAILDSFDKQNEKVRQEQEAAAREQELAEQEKNEQKDA